MTEVQVGFLLVPDEETLALTEPLLELADYLEVAPETTWREAPDGRIVVALPPCSALVLGP